jgi:hypothetical protein
MKPEDWVKAIYTYGPFALLVFFMVYGEARTRSSLRDADVNKKVSIPIYVANWIVIFTLMGFALSAWYRLTFNTEFTLRGTLQHLQGGESLGSNDDRLSLFLNKKYDTKDGRFHYAWRLITPKQLKQGDKVPFVLELGTADKEDTRNYNVPISADSYKGEITLNYDRQKDKLILHDGQVHQELKPEAMEEAREEAAPTSLFVWKVEAQAAQQTVPFKDRLEAPDPIIRRQAWQDLAQQHQQQWQFIDSALANPASSYRVKLGVISALNSSKCADLNKLSSAALQTVIRASGDPDPTLRGLARGCLVAQASPAIDTGLDTAIRSSGGNSAELARTQLEVLYALGIAAKDRYGSRKAQDRKEFDRAVADFAKAWGLRQFAKAPDRVIFAKALYGWGLALHDRSWIDRDATHQRRADYVRAAQNKFSEFLKEVQGSGNAKEVQGSANAAAYPYQNHIRQAQAYVKSPEPQSLQIQ